MADEIKGPAEEYIAAANLPSGAIAAEDFLPATTRTRAVADALATYSRISPKRKAGEITGDGTTYYDLSVLTGWDETLSGVTEVEYPYAAATLGQNTLHSDAWEVLDHPTNGKTLRLLEDTPTTSQKVLVVFSATWAEAEVPTAHIGAVAKLAASNMALALAARTSANKEITVGGNWNGQTARQAYGDLARTLRAEGMKDLGVGAEGGSGGSSEEPACAVQAIDRDQMTSHGYGRLTRGRRRYY